MKEKYSTKSISLQTQYTDTKKSSNINKNRYIINPGQKKEAQGLPTGRNNLPAMQTNPARESTGPPRSHHPLALHAVGPW